MNHVVLAIAIGADAAIHAAKNLFVKWRAIEDVLSQLDNPFFMCFCDDCINFLNALKVI